MQQKILSRQRCHERGQTILLVAISMVSLLAMAALAIDIVTLYVARSEIQRAADAAALAAAKAIADSGFTTLPSGDLNYGTAQTLAQNMAVKAVNAMLTTASINMVDGKLPLQPSPLAFDFTTHPGSYQVTVSLKASNLPTFFAKIWGASAPSVVASATAEAYNPANLSPFTPIAPLSLKPWLVANVDPNNSTPNTPFVNITTGAVEENITREQLNLVADCKNSNPNKCKLRTGHNPPKAGPSLEVDYVPLEVSSPPNSKNVCPLCAAGATDYEQSIACADATTYVTPTCGGGATNAVWSEAFNPRGVAGQGATGTECLIHAAGAGPYDGANNLQDTLDVLPWPTNPMKIKAESGLQAGNLVTTSSSIVTIPILDARLPLPPSPGAVTVVGYIQAFINEVNPGSGAPDPGSINITVLNISACSAVANSANPVIGGSGTSPVPVRLIAP